MGSYSRVSVQQQIPSLMFWIIAVPLLLLLLLRIPGAKSLNFSFNSFGPNTPNIHYEGNATSSTNGVIQLTTNQRDASLNSSVGRASYDQPVRLWDNTTTTGSTAKVVTDFTSYFSFDIKQAQGGDGSSDTDTAGSTTGDGLSFFLVPFNSSLPDGSTGGYLGLVTPKSFDNTSQNQFVAVEFDTFKNPWDPSSYHVGIDVNSIISDSVANVSWSSIIMDGFTANAVINYDSSTHNLSVFLIYDGQNPVFNGNCSLWYQIDLTTVLPESVRVGFSASTGRNTEIHNIRSWNFSSTLADPDMSSNNNTNSIPTAQGGHDRGKSKSRGSLIGGVIAAIGVLTIIVVGSIAFTWWRRRRRRSSYSTRRNEYEMDFDVDDHEFEKGTGPRRFTYGELCRATNNFTEEGKLGEGGFGGVYKGWLADDPTPLREIAVKKISRGSKQGKKEYVSEVKIISRLRHRNLVQLLGWCHDQGDLLLVYEFMPNGSLDTYLYLHPHGGGMRNNNNKAVLEWTVRYKIAHGLASALLYLHEEWEQCVVHRDVKSSNVMLDSNFNAKLGDFGLARLVDHGLVGSQTTVLAGTLGYLAPECFTTGKASKESDVYSFGVVALEITCGRRPVESMEEASKVKMVEWVWDLYGKGLLLDAVDKGLEGKYDVQQMECLMVIGLWCCHPDYTRRPSVRQLINVLNSEAPLPNLPPKLPVPIYISPPMNMNTEMFSSYTLSSSGFTGSSSGTTNSSVVSGTAPFLTHQA